MKMFKRVMVGEVIDWAGTWEELMQFSATFHVWVNFTGRTYAGGHPAVEVIGDQRNVDEFLAEYNKAQTNS